MRLVIYFSAVPKFLLIGLKDQLVSLKDKLFLLFHNLNSVQETAVYKFYELCQLQRPAEARFNALLPILNFQQLFQSGENICQLVVCRCFIWRTKAELRARVGRPQTSSSPQYFLLLAVPRRLFCFGSLVILDVARCYLWLFTLYINIKISKNSC